MNAQEKAIKKMQFKQGNWHANMRGRRMDDAREYREKSNDPRYVRESCLDLMRTSVERARKHNHVSMQYRRGELTV